MLAGKSFALFCGSWVNFWRVEADFHNIPLLFNNSPIEAPAPTAFFSIERDGGLRF
jgi:hypothetical protein